MRNEYSYQYRTCGHLTKATTDSISTAFVDLTTKMEDGPEDHQDGTRRGAPKGAGWDKSSRLPLGTAESAPWPRPVRTPPSLTTART